ncbi:MAG: hypothetical protein IKY70_06090 [Bacteroidales bacterium]|nr:hypothetical protein [Bacteroidales bacterium]
MLEKVDIMRMPKTFILMWNPSISSYTMERFEEDLRDIANGWKLEDFNWSVWDYENAREGDSFYMVKVGPGTNGIVMSGTFSSNPYQDKDWSGKGRKVFYMDMLIKEMIHPDRCPILSSEKLATEMPDFVWNGGHSGQLLNEEQADKLNDSVKYMRFNFSGYFDVSGFG